MATSLKSSQLQAVSRMLNLNEDIASTSQSTAGMLSGNDLPPAGTPQNQWKILVYDAPCRSIISPLLSVSQLRRRGVTLHLLIQNDREPIPDVPAVYFVEPTRANLTQIAADCAKGLYASFHLNFVTRLDRSLMEEFARLVVQSGSISRIASIHDQYLDYVCLEKSLFTLNKKESYVLYNGSGVTESVIENAMNEIAYGLFSVVATMGCVPVIRCPKGAAPEMVARKLNKMISDHPTLIRGRGTSGSATQSHHRPLLVIMDRNSDLITPIQHTSTYQALIDDVLNHNANRIEFVVKTEEHGRTKSVTKRFDLEADDDPFYSVHKFNPFPEAIESNGAELTDVTNRENEIRSKASGGAKGGDGNMGVSVDDPMSSTATDLATAVDSLPALLERKKQLEVHTSILQAVMNEVAARDVPQFYELESSLATGNYKSDLAQAKRDVLELVTDPAKGNVQDKVRLVIVYCLATTAPSADIDEVAGGMKTALETKGSAVTTGAQHGTLSIDDKKKLEQGMRAIDYLKKIRSMQMIPNMSDAMQETTSGGDGANSDMLSAFMARATNQATGLLAKATEKVGSMLGKIHKHRATLVVENLCNMKPNSEDEEYLYLDPKVKGDVDVSALRNMTRAPVRDVIAFMIGGGCYAEYQNLQMISNERRVVSYGSTELIDPCVFLNQLGKLA